MILADLADQSVSTAAIGALVMGALGVLGFLVRNAFEATTRAVSELGVKLEKLGADISRGDGDRRELAAEVRAIRDRLDRLERNVSEGVAR
jgi:hypothetical protein